MVSALVVGGVKSLEKGSTTIGTVKEGSFVVVPEINEADIILFRLSAPTLMASP